MGVIKVFKIIAGLLFWAGCITIWHLLGWKVAIALICMLTGTMVHYAMEQLEKEL